MQLFDVIDSLFVLTQYLAWAIALVGIPVSVVLLVVNVPMGLGSAAVFLAALLLALGVTALLAPAPVANLLPVVRSLVVPAIACCVAAVAVMGLVYFLCGGFPALNLLFI